MNPLLLLAALRARTRVFLVVLGATLAVTLLVTLLMPRTYLASAALVVDSRDDQSLSASAADAHVRERLGYMQTQVDIISSEKVARKVVDALDLARQPKARAKFASETDGEGDIEDWLVTGLLKDLKVDTSQSSVIRIIYTANDAQFAAMVANAFARGYMETALELRVEPSRQTAAWFDEQMRGLRANLEQAQARLTEFQRSKGIVDERFDIENLTLSDLAAQMTRLQSQRAGVAPPEALLGPAGQSVRGELLRAEAKLQELSSRLGVNHPWYQRQQAEVQHLRARLAEESGRTPGSSGRQREADLRSAIAAQQTRVLELKQYRDHVQVLARDVEIAQRAYEIALQSAVNKKVESRASQTNISLLHAAVPPFKPHRPRVLLNVVLGLVIGTLLGLSLIYLMELRDQRVRSPLDLQNDLRVPVLAELSAWPVPPRLAGGLPVLPHSG